MFFRRQFYLYVVLCCLLIMPYSAGAQSANDCDPALDFDTLTDRAIEALNAGELETAIAEARCALEAEPENTLAHSNLGFLMGQLGETDEALEFYATALQLDPESRTALVNRASLYRNLERYEDAIADYDAAIAIQPTPVAFNLRGVSYFMLNDFEAAEVDFAEAMTLDSTNPDYPRNRAAARFELERYNDAYEDFATASQLAPNWEVPVFGMADSLYSARRYDEALAIYRDGIARFGSNDSRDARLVRLSVIRSGLLLDNRTPSAPGAITADTLSALIPMTYLDRESADLIVEETVNPDGSLLAAANSDGIIRFWDSEGTLLSELDVQGSVKNLTFSPNNSQLALIADNQRIVLIATGSQTITAAWDGGENAGSSALQGIAYSPEGALLAAIWEDGTIRIYDAVLQLPVAVITQIEAVLSADSGIAFGPNGRYLAISVNESSVQIWDVFENTLITTWSGAEEAVHTLTFNPSGDRLYGGSDEALYYWNSDGATPAITQIEMDAPVTDIRFSLDDQLVAVAADNIEFFDATTMEPLAELSGEDGAWMSIAFSPDGNRLVAAQAADSENRLVVLEPLTTTVTVETETYTTVTAENASSLELITEVPLNEPRGVIWSADGDTLYVASETGVFSFPVDGDAASFIVQPRGTFAIHEGSPIYQAIVTGEDGEQTLIVYDVEDFGEPLLRLDVDDRAIWSFVYGDNLIAADGFFNPELLRLPLDGSEPEPIVAGGTESLYGIAVRPDGVSAVAVRDPDSEDVRNLTISMFEADGSAYASINAPIPYVDIAGEVQLGFIRELTFSPDGSMLAGFGSPDILRVWQETEPGVWRADANIEPPTGAGSPHFSPSGEWLLSRGNDEIVLWHIDTSSDRSQIAEVARIPVSASAALGAIRFNADDTLLAVVTNNDMLQIWGIES